MSLNYISQIHVSYDVLLMSCRSHLQSLSYIGLVVSFSLFVGLVYFWRYTFARSKKIIPKKGSKDRSNASAQKSNVQTESGDTSLRSMLSSITVPFMPSLRIQANSTPEKLGPATVQKTNSVDTLSLVKQSYDSFLVLDVEATCIEGTGFDWPNEIIEWPVCLLRWADKNEQGRASKLVVVDEFRSFVRPMWRPELSPFCTSLTRITQADVVRAPKFETVLDEFKKFMIKHHLIDANTGKSLERFAWCTDGPFDIRDFVVKQCFISKINMPEWLHQDVLDVRKAVGLWFADQEYQHSKRRDAKVDAFPRRPSLNISQQLRALDLSAFEGRQHCGIDDTRNIARILTELARRGVCLQANTIIRPGRRWQWMGKPGEILEEYCITR